MDNSLQLHAQHIACRRRPYGFLERFDPNFTPNTTDLNGRRYNFRSQPEARSLLLVTHCSYAAGMSSSRNANLFDLKRCQAAHVLSDLRSGVDLTGTPFLCRFASGTWRSLQTPSSRAISSTS